MAEVETADHLSLADNAKVAKLLAEYSKKSKTPEKVLFSDFVIKINRKDKEQTRVMLITDRAMYNLMPHDYGKCKRRINIDSITYITTSSISEEFVIHVPDEYDYRFKSGKKKKICSFLRKIYNTIMEQKIKDGEKVEQPKLSVGSLSQSDLKDLTLTKDMARLQSREERHKRRQQLTSDAPDSDNEEDAASREEEKRDQITQLIDHTEKVRLEDFELLKVLGRGSFGKVMQVKKKSTGAVYAMKILKKKAIVARNQVEHTKAERQILQSLQHPFLMTLRYAFQSKEKLYFVLDYYQGGELFFHLKNMRRFPEATAKIFVAEIGLALGHLHSLGVVYRDLKPENILLDDKGHVCLTDFGLSKDIEENEQAHTFCGTPEYLAPEIVTGVGHGMPVDWWSLGILLYELTVGIPPFYSQNVNEMYNKIQHGVLRFPPFLSEECKSLIVGLLHRDPTKRLGSKNDIDDIKAHAFFKDLDFEKLMKKEIASGYVPKVKGKADTTNFDETFTAEPAVDTMVPESEMPKAEEADAFNSFTFQPKDSHLDR